MRKTYQSSIDATKRWKEKNKERLKEDRKRKYSTWKEYYQGYQREYIKKIKADRSAFIKEYLLSNPCIDCGETDTIVLEFDHVRGEKINNVSKMVQSGASIDKIKSEIDKCEVRCANCHRRVTHNRRQANKTNH